MQTGNAKGEGKDVHEEVVAVAGARGRKGSEREPLLKRKEESLQPSSRRTLYNYQRLAAIYDCWASWEEPYRKRAFDALQLRASESFLEIGIATGSFLALAARVGAQCVGIDLSPKMVQRAVVRCEEDMGAEYVRSHIKFFAGDAMELLDHDASKPQGIGHFDACAICFTLELFTDAEIVMLLRKVRARLEQKSGRIVAVSMSSSVRSRCAMSCYSLSRSCCPSIVDCRPIELRELIMQSQCFDIVQHEVLPMYGLAVEIVVGRVRR